MPKGMANSGPAPSEICATEAFQENRNASLRNHVWDDRKTLRLDFYLMHRKSPALGVNAQVSHMTIRRLIGTQPRCQPDLTNRWLQQHDTAMVTLQSRNDAAKSKVCEHLFALLHGSGFHSGDACLARSFALGF